MRNRLVKVDRVGSVEEALELEGLGASMLAVNVVADPRFDDGRTLSLMEAAEISHALQAASLVLVTDLADSVEHILQVVDSVGTTMVQHFNIVIPSKPVRDALRRAGVRIVYGGLEISHDDDPAWVLSAHLAEPDLDAFLFQADVLPEYRSSWNFLRFESPEYPEEFQLADLEELAASHPLAVAFDFTPDNVLEITAALPSVRGITLTLADHARRDGVHFHSHAQARRVLQALSQETS